MTREEWLRCAIENIDTAIFNGDLDTINHKYQITCGICPGKKITNTIQPYDGEDVKLDDFFPTTISVDHTIDDPIEIITNLTYECVFAFFNEKKVNKRVKKLLEKYYFEKPYTSCTPSTHLMDLVVMVYELVKRQCGEFPGQRVVIHKKEKKDSKKNIVIVSCPNCGIEYKVNRKMWEKNTSGLPTCGCGAKMIVLDDEQMQSED